MPDPFRITEQVGPAQIERSATLEERRLQDLLRGLSLTNRERNRIWGARGSDDDLVGALRQSTITDAERSSIWDLRMGRKYGPQPVTVPGLEDLPATRMTQRGGYIHPETTLGELPPPPAPPSIENIPTDWKQRAVGFVSDVAERVLAPKGSRFERGRKLEEPITDLTKLVPGVAERRPGQVGWGALRGVGEVVSGLTSTENAMLIAAMPLLAGGGAVATAARQTVATFFGTEIGKGMLAESPELQDAVNRQDWPGVSQIGGRLLAQAGMLYGIGRHTAKGLMPATPGKLTLTDQERLYPDVLPPEGPGYQRKITGPPGPRLALLPPPPERVFYAGPEGVELPGLAQPAEAVIRQPRADVVPEMHRGAGVGVEPIVPPWEQPGLAALPGPPAPWEAPPEIFGPIAAPPAAAPAARPRPGLPPGWTPWAGVEMPPDLAAMPTAIRPADLPEPGPVERARARVDRAVATLEKKTAEVRNPGMSDVDLWDVPRWAKARREVDRARRQLQKAEGEAGAVAKSVQASTAGAAAFQRFAQAAGELAPLPARETVGTVVPGNPVSVRVPGQDRRYEARYSVRDAMDVVPSHNAWTFEANPRYEHTNTRNYDDPRNQAKVLDHVARFDPEFVLTENLTAEHGPPIVDANGNVLGGNDRSMTLKRILTDRPDAAERYKAELVSRAEKYGLDPEQIAAMDAPILVREVPMQPDVQRAVIDFNKKGPAAHTESEAAIAGASQVSVRTIERISSGLEVLGEEGTMAKALDGPGGVEILDLLVRDGAIEGGERGSMLNENGLLTVEAKKRIAKMTLGGLFRSADQMDRTPEQIRGKLERAAGPVIRSAGNPEWSLLDKVQEGLDALEEAGARKVANLADLRQQPEVLTGEPRYSEHGIELARVLRDEPTQDIGPAFRDYAEAEQRSRPGQPKAMFEVPDQETAFRESFSREAFRSRRQERAAGAKRLRGLMADPTRVWLTPEDMAKPAPGDLGTEGPSGIGPTLERFLKDEGGWSSFELEALKGIVERDWEGMRRAGRRARKALALSSGVAGDYRRVWLNNPDAGWFSRAFDHPLHIAWKHKEFRPVLLRAMAMDHEGRQLAADLASRLKPYLNLRPADQHAVDEVGVQARLTHTRLGDMDMSALTEVQRGAVNAIQNTMDRGFELMADNTVNLATKGRVTSSGGINSPQDLYAEISQTGLNPNQAREIAQEAWQLLEHFREQKRAGYVPFSRFGQYHFGVIDKASGTPLYWGAEKILANASTRAADLAQRFRNEIAAGTAELIEPKEKMNTSATLLEGMGGLEIGWLGRLAKVDPELGQAFQQQVDAFTRRLGFRSHLNRATDVPGFERNLRRSLVDYTLGVSRYVAKSKGLRNMRTEAEKIPVRSGPSPFVAPSALGGLPLPPPEAGAIPKPKLAKYAKDYIDYQRDPGQEAQFLRSALFHYYLGFVNIKSAAVNLSQVPLMTAPWLMQYAGTGRVAYEVGRAYKDVARAISPRGIDYELLPRDVRDAAKASREAGTVGQQGWQELAGIQFGVHPLADTLGKASASLFSATEHTNRLVSHIAAQRIFESRAGSPKFRKFADKRAFAESVVDNTQLAYGKWNRALYTRSKIFGVSTAPLMIFRSFTKGYLEMLSRLYSEDPKAFAAAVGLMAVSSGAMGLPFAKDVEDFGSAVWSWKRGEKVDLHAASHDIASQVFGAEGADFFEHGISSFLPWDVSGSLGMGRIVPAAGILNLVRGEPGALRELSAALEVPGRVTEGIAALLQDEPWRAGELLAPRSVSQFLRSQRYAEEGLRTRSGGQVMLPGGAPGLTGAELAGQAIGFLPTSVRQARERQTAHTALGVAGSRQRQVVLSRVAAAYQSRDWNQIRPALDAIIAHDKTASLEDQIGFEGIEAAIENRMTPALTRELEGLPERKRIAWLKQQNVWPGYGKMTPLPSPPSP